MIVEISREINEESFPHEWFATSERDEEKVVLNNEVRDAPHILIREFW
jgi:hypothetical protein